MKIARTEYILRQGTFASSPEWTARFDEICTAIKAVAWPPGSGSFTLFEESGKKRGEGNGVTPIKAACMAHLQACGWTLEAKLDVVSVRKMGRIDAACAIGNKLLCVEWETGNISSSHRALNKISVGLLKNAVIGGVLILPTRKMYGYLTDRVGNYEEIEPYFSVWSSLPVTEGVLAVIAIEHDAVSHDVPRIPKGTDGRALQ